MQDDILKKFLDDTTNLSQKIDRTIEAWEASDGRVSLAKRTAMSLEPMHGDLQDRLRDVNEAWEEMENDNDGNKKSRSALSRSVRQAAKSTKSASDQIDTFQQEWQEKIDCEKQPIAQRQTEKHTEQTPAFPSHEHFDRP